MAENKITRKDLFARIATVMADDVEVVEMCEKYIEQLNRPRVKKENTEMMEWRAAVASWLQEQEEPVDQTAAGVALEVSGSKAGAALRWLVENGHAEVVQVEGTKTKHYAPIVSE